MKKFSLILLTLCLVAMPLAFCACGSSHEHTLEWVEIDPTCTEDGVRYQTCTDCSVQIGESETIPATGHTPKTIPGYDSTCIDIGLTAKLVCDTCGTTLIPEEPIPLKKEHYYENEVCKLCGKNQYGDLAFELSEDETYYIVSAGTYFGETLVIPSTYEDLPVREIAEEGFSSCNRIKNLTIPESVVKIGNRAFDDNNDNSRLVSVTILGACDIGKEAFNGCKFINSLTLAEGVKSIGASAFLGCMGITEIIIPASVTSLGERAFDDCRQLDKIVFAEGSQVETIPKSCFYLSKKAYGESYTTTSLTLPEGLKRIEEYAFCSAYLTKVTLPETLIYIGQEAFSYCDLTEVYIPASVQGIGRAAFMGNAIETLTVPFLGTSRTGEKYENDHTGSDYTTALRYIFGYDSFNNSKNTSLTRLTILPGITTISSFQASDFKNLIWVEIPEGVTELKQSAFVNSTLKSIELPSTLESIGKDAFSNCPYLFEIINHSRKLLFEKGSDNYGYIAKNVVYLIQSNAAIGAESMININDDGVVVLSYEGYIIEYLGNATELTLGADKYSHLTIAGNAFSGNTTLQKVNIEAGILGITSSAFYGCTALTEVYFASNSPITKLYATFADCTALTTVTLPSKLTTLERTFLGCTALKSVEIPSSVTKIFEAFNKYDSLENLIYEDGVYYLSDWVIGSNPADMPESLTLMKVKGIAGGALDVSGGSKSITVPYSFQYICYGKGDYDMSYKAFSREVEALSLPFLGYTEGVPCELYKYFNLSASNLSSLKLKQLTVRNGMILDSALWHATTLESVTLEYLVDYIGAAAFAGCTSLKSIEIGHGVTVIGNSAFSNCTALTSVTFANGSKLESIGTELFSGCTSLDGVAFPATVTKIPAKTFYGCTSLKSIEIGNGVTVIGNSAFSNCTALTSVTFAQGSNLESIGTELFSGCTSLGGVAFPATITKIPAKTFYGCTSIEAIKIGAGVTEIGDSAFYGCTGIKWVVLPATLEAINDNAFDKCTSLTKIYYGSTETDWAELNYTAPTDVTVYYYYFATEPTTEGNYWYEDANNGYLPVEL